MAAPSADRSFDRVRLAWGLVAPLWFAAICCRLIPGAYPPAWEPGGRDLLIWLGLGSGALLAGYELRRAWSRGTRPRLTAASWGYPFFWAALVQLCDAAGWEAGRVAAVQIGQIGLFVLGLGWLAWLLEQATQAGESARQAAAPVAPAPPAVAETVRNERRGVRLRRPDRPTVRNPFDAAAWYFGRDGRFNQSLSFFVAYGLLFLCAVLGVGRLSGCAELYEMPAGGGQERPLAQKIQTQKIIRKKFVINPYSSILFRERQIEEVKLQLEEMTAHEYTVGYGQGTGAGYAGGTQRGKVRFIRLEYQGGDWNQDFGIGADLNMLIQYHVRTGQKVESRTESRTVAQLKNFPLGASPPFVYLTGERSIQLSKSEIEILREYLTTKHGMLFGDNGGSRHFHNQFVSMMQAVLPTVQPVPIPLDDRIHRIPYTIPFLPMVAPHGGKEALGWKVDGRWVAYYHPGDIADAWAEGHAGVRPDVVEFCYQLGTNVIHYAHAEYARWLESQRTSPAR